VRSLEKKISRDHNLPKLREESVFSLASGEKGSRNTKSHQKRVSYCPIKDELEGRYFLPWGGEKQAATALKAGLRRDKSKHFAGETHSSDRGKNHHRKKKKNRARQA